MIDCLIYLLASIFLPVLIVSILMTRTKECPECDGRMKEMTYVGDGDGPAVDHIHYKCPRCGYTENELV